MLRILRALTPVDSFCEVVEGLAQEARRPDGGIANGLAQFGRGHGHHRPNQRPGRVILAPVASGIAHILDLGLIQMRQLMLLGLRGKVQLVNRVNNVPQIVATLNPVLNLPKNLADLVLNRVGPGGLLLKPVQVGEQLAIDEENQIVAGQRCVVVQLSLRILGRGPGAPAVRLLENVVVGFAIQRRLGGFVLLQSVEILQKQQPGGLLGVVQLAGATGIFPQHVINVLKGLFKHKNPLSFRRV